MNSEQPSQKIRLTVGIPTYNRNELLNQALKSVLQQADNRIDILILDNCSPVPAAESAKEILDQFRELGCGVRVVRNPVNIGGSLNIIFTLGQLESGWVWLLGDDDELSPSALSIIFNKIENAPENCVLVKFSQARNPMPPVSDEVYSSLGEVEAKLSKHGYKWLHNLGFISTSVYRVDELRRHIAISCHFSYTCFPQLIPVLFALKEGGSFLNCPDIIIDIDKSGKSTLAVDYTVARLGTCALGEIPGLRELSFRVSPRLAFCEYKYLLKHALIGLCYDCERNAFWASVNIRIGGSCRGVRGFIFLVCGWLQTWLIHIPLMWAAVRKLNDSMGKQPQWHSERS